MAVVDRLRQGQRVELLGCPIGVTLVSPTGTIVRPDTEWDGYYIVHLDAPATYNLGDGRTEPLLDIREAEDNLRPLLAVR